MKKIYVITIIVVLILLAVVLIYQLTSKTPTDRIDISVGNGAVKGYTDAPVTIVEFSEFQCPFCARFSLQTLPLIEEQYINTGKVKMVFRNFPLSLHEYAQKAAEAAECVHEQDITNNDSSYTLYWKYHDILFQNQDNLDIDSLKQYAKDIGLDTAKFSECLDSGKMLDVVAKDIADGNKYGVTGTPTFFINGIRVVGSQPFNAFEQIIEQELQKN